MRKTLLTTILLMIALLALAGTTTADEATIRTLEGEYHWTQADDRGQLEAVFTATGESTWSVDFHFHFQGQDHTYSGSATGSLTDGKLEGVVKNEGKNRTFTFTGEVAEGRFEGTHEETTKGRERRTGTMFLAAP